MNEEPYDHYVEEARREDRSWVQIFWLPTMVISIVATIASIYFLKNPTEHTTTDAWAWICGISGASSLICVIFVCRYFLRRKN